MRTLSLMVGMVSAALFVAAMKPGYAASPRSNASLSYQVPLPTYVPPDKPPPQADAVAGYDRAPLPDDDLRQKAAGTTRSGVTPMLFRPQPQYRGEAFMPGSSADSAEQRGVRPGFGLSLTQPMQ